MERSDFSPHPLEMTRSRPLVEMAGQTPHPPNPEMTRSRAVARMAGLTSCRQAVVPDVLGTSSPCCVSLVRFHRLGVLMQGLPSLQEH